jgi:hypothetical protein
MMERDEPDLPRSKSLRWGNQTMFSIIAILTADGPLTAKQLHSELLRRGIRFPFPSLREYLKHDYEQEHGEFIQKYFPEHLRPARVTIYDTAKSQGGPYLWHISPHTAQLIRSELDGLIQAIKTGI